MARDQRTSRGLENTHNGSHLPRETLMGILSSLGPEPKFEGAERLKPDKSNFERNENLNKMR